MWSEFITDGADEVFINLFIITLAADLKGIKYTASYTYKTKSGALVRRRWGFSSYCYTLCTSPSWSSLFLCGLSKIWWRK